MPRTWMDALIWIGCLVVCFCWHFFDEPSHVRMFLWFVMLCPSPSLYQIALNMFQSQVHTLNLTHTHTHTSGKQPVHGFEATQPESLEMYAQQKLKPISPSTNRVALELDSKTVAFSSKLTMKRSSFSVLDKSGGHLENNTYLEDPARRSWYHLFHGRSDETHMYPKHIKKNGSIVWKTMGRYLCSPSFPTKHFSVTSILWLCGFGLASTETTLKAAHVSVLLCSTSLGHGILSFP